MPAKSKAQQKFFGAEYARALAHKPTVTGLALSKLREFAATKRKGLPARKRKH